MEQENQVEEPVEIKNIYFADSVKMEVKEYVVEVTRNEFVGVTYHDTKSQRHFHHPELFSDSREEAEQRLVTQLRDKRFEMLGNLRKIERVIAQLTNTSTTKLVDLTDKEWVSLIDKDGEGLGLCCANISALRDAIIDILRNGKEIDFISGHRFIQAFAHCNDGSHGDMYQGTIGKLARQVEAELAYTAPSHQEEPLTLGATE